MFNSKIRLLVASAFLCGSLVSANAPASDLNGFDFGYSVQIDKDIGVIQVFDDGDRTYFQLNQFDKIPQIYIDQNGKKTEVRLEIRPPYVIAQGVAKRFTLTTGKRAISVSYNGERPIRNEMAPTISPIPAPVSKQEIAKVQPKTPVPNRNDVDEIEENRRIDRLERAAQIERVQAARKISRPVVKDEVAYKSDKAPSMLSGVVLNVPYFENSVTMSKRAREDMLQQLPAIEKAGQIIVRGRPSAPGDISVARSRSYSLKGFLMENGIDEANIKVMVDEKVKEGKNSGFYLSEVILFEASDSSVASAEPKPKPVQTWDFTKDDPTVKTALQRWGKLSGWNISWEAPVDFPVAVPAGFGTNFEEAVSSVVKGLQQSANPVRAQFYNGNKVLRIVSMNGDK